MTKRSSRNRSPKMSNLWNENLPHHPISFRDRRLRSERQGEVTLKIFNNLPPLPFGHLSYPLAPVHLYLRSPVLLLLLLLFLLLFLLLLLLLLLLLQFLPHPPPLILSLIHRPYGFRWKKRKIKAG